MWIWIGRLKTLLTWLATSRVTLSMLRGDGIRGQGAGAATLGRGWLITSRETTSTGGDTAGSNPRAGSSVALKSSADAAIGRSPNIPTTQT